MFPLGTVLFPGAVLPLHVFEPRYRQLVRDCTLGDREFGVVLIERGSEVGGGDVRSMAGTVARIVQARRDADGRCVLVTVGTRRIRVDTRGSPTIRTPGPRWRTGQTNRRADGFAEPLGRERWRGCAACSPSTPSSASRPPRPPPSWTTTRCWRATTAAAVAPFGPADHFDLLVAPGPDARLLRVCVDELLAGRRGGGRASSGCRPTRARRIDRVRSEC